MTKLVAVYSTGRSGTALLAQYFGGRILDQDDWKWRNGFAVAHEPFDKFSEYWSAIRRLRENQESGIIAFLEEQLATHRGYSAFLITDNKLGRWFCRDLCSSDIETKIIYLYRSRDSVIQSITKAAAPRYLQCWMFTPSGECKNNPARREAIIYHVDETRRRWMRDRESLGRKDFLEVSFERFLRDRDHRRQVEEFVGLSGLEEMLSIKVNRSYPLIRGKFYSPLKAHEMALLLAKRLYRRLRPR